MTACGGGCLSREGDLSPGGPRPLIPVCALTMPRLRAGGEPRSATMAVERLTFPLLMPPITLDARKAAKLSEAAHTAYEAARPACVRAGPRGRHGHLKPGGAQRLGQQSQQHPWDPALFWDSQGPLVFPLSRGCRSSCRTAWLRHRSYRTVKHHPQGANEGPTADPVLPRELLAGQEKAVCSRPARGLWAPIPGTAASLGAFPGSLRWLP